MAKITEYPEALSFDAGDVILKDGTNGTKKMTAETLKSLIAPVDSTLSQTGKAADAKAVGDAAKALERTVNGIGDVALSGEEVNLSQYASTGAFISTSSGKWITGSGDECWIAPIYEDIKFVSVTANSSQPAMVALLTTNSHTAGTDPDYVTGESMVVIEAGATKLVEIPSGCQYCYIAKANGGTNYTPASFKYETPAVPPVDNTLSITGRPADAKAVGDAVNKLITVYKVETNSAGSSAGIAYLRNAAARNAKTVIVKIDPVQGGTGDPSQENVRTIDGSTVVDFRWGKGNLNTSAIAGHFINENGAETSSSGYMVSSHIDVSDFSDIRVYYYNNTNGYKLHRVCFYDSNGDFIAGSLISGGANSKKYATITGSVPSNAVTMRVGCGSSTYMVVQGDSRALTSIQLPVAAGTVYGGYLDITGGKLVVTKANIPSYAGEELPGAWISSMDVYEEGTTPTNGAQVVYDLAEPVTYDITPREVPLNEGDNLLMSIKSLPNVRGLYVEYEVDERSKETDDPEHDSPDDDLVQVSASPVLISGSMYKLTGNTFSSAKYYYSPLNPGYGTWDAIEMTDSNYAIALRFYKSNGNVSNGLGYIGGTDYVSGKRLYVPADAAYVSINVNRVDGQELNNEQDAVRAGIKVYSYSCNIVKREKAIEDGTYSYRPIVAVADSYINSSGVENTSSILSRYLPLPVMYGHIYRITIVPTNAFTFFVHGVSGDTEQTYDQTKWIKKLYAGNLVNSTTFSVDIVINDERIKNVVFSTRTNVSSVTFEHIGVFNDDGLGLHVLPPVNNIKNVVKRARHFTDIKWTPKVDLPRVARIMNGRYTTGYGNSYDNIYKAGVTYTGFPYSTGNATAMATYGYSNVHMTYEVPIDSFMTSLDNPNSFLNTQSRPTSSQSNDLFSTAYGTVCDNLVCYALGIEWKGSHAGFTDLVESQRLWLATAVSDIDENIGKVEVGDPLIYINNHVTIITDIIKNQDGSIYGFEVSESTTAEMTRNDVSGGLYGGVCRRCVFALPEFKVRFANYTIYHSSDVYKTTYEQNPWIAVGDEKPLHNLMAMGEMPCMPYMGENFVYKVGYIPNSKILISEEIYGYMAVYKDGELFNTFTYTPSSGEIDVGFTTAGNYEAFLFNSTDGTIENMTNSSLGCHWKVIS